jgi:hypothetical protein
MTYKGGKTRPRGFLLLPGGMEYDAGQWHKIARHITHTCCDCRATHHFEFRIRGDEIEMRGWTEEDLTELRRADD